MEMGGNKQGEGWLSRRGGLVVRLLATTTLWVQIQASLKHTKWAT